MSQKQNNNSGKEFEKKIFSLLKAMGITPKGYYAYSDFADLVGYQKPEWPYTIPLKILVEISKGKLTIDKVLSFAKAVKDNQCTKALIFGTEDIKELNKDLTTTIQTMGIEYFGPKDIEKLLKGKSITPEQVQEYKKASEVVAAQKLVDSLPNLALQEIPKDILVAMEAANPGLKIPAWDIFEEAVYAAFLYCLGYKVRQLGKEAKFEHEPEGVVAQTNQNRLGFLYECKSAEKEYKITSEDKVIFIDYIRQKKHEVSAKDGVELRYFVVVGPEFKGDKENRRNEIHRETGVLLIYLKASTLKILAQWACGINDPAIKQAIDIGEIFSKVNELEVEEKTIQEYIKIFDAEWKKRY